MELELHNICVYIEDEAHLNEARELLERFGQKLAEDGTFTFSINNLYLNFLRFSKVWGNKWYLGTLSYNNQINLTELQKLLEHAQNADN